MKQIKFNFLFELQQNVSKSDEFIKQLQLLYIEGFFHLRKNCSTVVGHTLHHRKVEGLSPSANSGNGKRENVEKTCSNFELEQIA